MYVRRIEFAKAKTASSARRAHQTSLCATLHGAATRDIDTLSVYS